MEGGREGGREGEMEPSPFQARVSMCHKTLVSDDLQKKSQSTTVDKMNLNGRERGKADKEACTHQRCSWLDSENRPETEYSRCL